MSSYLGGSLHDVGYAITLCGMYNRTGTTMNQRSNNASAAHATPSVQADMLTTRLRSWSGALLIAGGALMVIMYALEIVYGMQSGAPFGPEDLGRSALALVGSMTFALGLLLIGAGLLGTSWALRAYAPIVAALSLVLALVPIGAMAVNLTLISGVTGQPTLLGELGGLAVVTNLASATLLGIAVLRTRALPHAIGIMLLTVGLITFPCILLTIPLEAVLPPYIVGDLPFPVWGVVFAALGGLMLRNAARQKVPETPPVG
jgi:hypothetical protein